MIYYTSDSHLGHKNIVQYSRRPFADVTHMDVNILGALRRAEAYGGAVIHCGDLAFNLRKIRKQYGPIFLDPGQHTIVPGNHDPVRKQRAEYEAEFGRVVGDERSWRENELLIADWLHGTAVQVLVTHAPRRELPAGVDYNVYGHVHNKLVHPEIFADWLARNPERDRDAQYETWLVKSPHHLNACVELHEFRPVTLEELLITHRLLQRAA